MNAPEAPNNPPVISPAIPPPLPAAPPVLGAGSEMPPVQPKGPWGGWASFGFSLVIALASMSSEAIPGIFFGIYHAASGHLEILRNPEALQSNGLLLSLATLFRTPVAVGLCLLFARLRGGPNLKEYFGLSWPARNVLIRWSLMLMLLVAATDACSVLTGQPVVPEFMTKAWQSAGFLPLLWLALIVLAPLSEEYLFRGFFFKGLLHSRLGVAGAIFLTSLIWAAIHVQYNLYGIFCIFVGGIFMGIARYKTGSIWLCVWLHGLMNLIATIECAVKMAWLNGQ